MRIALLSHGCDHGTQQNGRKSLYRSEGMTERWGNDMNGEETLVLWRLGKSAWEGWVHGVIEKKNALVAAGSWSTDWYGEGQNDETKAWLQEATADFANVVFDADASFDGFTFPGPAVFEGAHFAGAAHFSGAAFMDNASFDRGRFAAGNFTGAVFSGFASFSRTQFHADASFDNAEFRRNCDLAPSVCFRGVQFSGVARFGGAQFTGAAEFPKASFASVQFDRCEFRNGALFASAQFSGKASFVNASFSGARVDFKHCVFSEEAHFTEAHFGGSWAGLVTSGAGCVSFESAQFEKNASFHKTWFVGESQFKNAQFNDAAVFDGALFVMPTNFVQTTFAKEASFTGARLQHEADFAEAQFLGVSDFAGAKFAGEARFLDARFADAARFTRAEFLGAADFRRVTAGAALALDGARCAIAPDFTGGAFTQTPSLARLSVSRQRTGLFWWLRRRPRITPPPLVPRVTQAPPAIQPETSPPAVAAENAAAPENTPEDAPGENNVVTLRTRAAAVALMAEQKREENPRGEEASGSPQPEQKPVAEAAAVNECDLPPSGKTMKVDNETHTRPAPGPEKAFEALRPAHSFIVRPESGRPRATLMKPLLAWLLLTASFTVFYLGQRPDGGSLAGGGVSSSSGPASGAAMSFIQASFDSLGNRSCVHGQSHAVAEALFLSARNALVFVPWENEQVMRRAYGCLYGVDGGAPAIPVAVSIGSLLQTALSFALLLRIFRAMAARWRED